MPLGSAYLFLWTFSKTTFKLNLTKLKELNNYKIVSFKRNIIIFLCVVFCTTLVIYKHPFCNFVLYWDETVIQLSAQRLNFLFEDDVKNAVIITICLFFDLWLNIFVPISIIYIMASGGSKGGRRGRAPPRGSKFFQFHAVFGKNRQIRMLAPPLGSWRPLLGEILDPPLMAIFIHFIEEFKYLNKELTLLIRSTAIYKSSELFSKWKKAHAQTSLVMSFFNNNIKVYINNIIFVACIGIMAVLYNTTVSCHGMSDGVLWISKYGILLFGVMLPSVSVNNQVMTFEIFDLYLLLLLNSGLRFGFEQSHVRHKIIGKIC